MEKKAKWFKPVAFPPWYKRLSTNFRQFFKKQHLVDIIFHCQDLEVVGGHKLVICQASPLFKQIIQTAGDIFNDDNIIHVSIPEVSKQTMSDFIESLYLGAIPTCQNTFQEFEILCDMFQIFSNPEEDDFDLSKDEIQNEPEISEEIAPNEEMDINYIKADGIEVFVVDNPVDTNEEDLEIRSSGKDVNAIKSMQEKPCSVCQEAGILHRVLINSEEDKRRLGIPIVPANEALRFLYRCCVQGCPFQNIRYLKSSSALHAHMQKHVLEPSESLSSVSSGGGKKCPLCSKPRILHRNSKASSENEPRKSNRGGGHLYKCCKCSASKLSAKKFFEHTQNHISKKFACSVCQKGFSQQRFLDHHVFVEHGEGKGQRFHCHHQNCNFEAKYMQTLASHIKEKHEGEKRSHRSQDAKSDVTCSACGKTLKKWYYQMYHKNSCSSSVVYRCEICGQDGFVNSTTLHNHVKAMHSTEKPFVCEHCPARYATSMSLSTHRARVHQVNKAGEHVPAKIFPCGLCGKFLTGKQKRDLHIKTVHEGAKDFSCQYCNKKFSTQSNLKVHEASLHTGDLPHKCTFCHKGFARRKVWEKHMEKCNNATTQDQVKTQGIIIVPNPSPYVPSIGDIIME